MPSPGRSVPQRVAVLGGGMAALTAAYELARLNIPGLPRRYDITVYQLGWRLGGKGASGRNVDAGLRIEEHGLHIWFGAYENAFRTMRNVYASCKDKWPFGDLKEGFQEQYGFDLLEHGSAGWRTWHFPLPAFSESSPGDGSPQGRCTPRGVLPRLASRLAHYYASRLHPLLEAMAMQPSPAGVQPASPLPSPSALHSLAQRLEAVAQSDNGSERKAIADAYERERASVDRQVHTFHTSAGAAVFDDAVRRAFIVWAIGCAVVEGTVLSRAWLDDDWDALNDWDLRDWLRQRLGAQAALADSAFVEASYDLYFSYVGGDPRQGSIEAGTMLRAAAWLLLEYKGAFMWRMRSGMGDTIFAPLYHALDSMGVRFEFFHKVKKLTADGSRITGIQLERQARVKATNQDQEPRYQPFVKDPKGRDCWPSRPDFSQLEEGGPLEADWDACELESDWSKWDAKLAPVVLKAGADFDHVVLGIPLGALKGICCDLPPLQQMISKVRTVQTQALQLWLKPSLNVLQGTSGQFDCLPISTTFQNPIDTYADMTHLAPREDWPNGAPGHIAYFCGVLQDSAMGSTPEENPGYPASALAAVRNHALNLFQAPGGPSGSPASPPMGDLWPMAFGSGQMDWKLLCEQGTDVDPLARQYLRANINASDRYAIAAAGTSRFRLKAGGSGYANLFLAGDWVYNGLFVGCIEGAVISGKQAARALSGAAIEVVGEGNLFARP